MLKRISTLCVGCFLSALVFATPLFSSFSDPFSPLSPPSRSLESVINHYVQSFRLSPDNRFKLAAYAELRGRYLSESQGLTLHFGSLGELSFFPKNLLYRTGDQKVYHLNTGEVSVKHAERINSQLAEMFERVILLGNHEAKPAHIEFVDEHLAKKNLEPFSKLFIRHILIKYGRYDSIQKEVIFHTTWLPENTYNFRNPGDARIVKKHITPLALKLSKKILRGYYLTTGGTVYMEDVKREVLFATGEEYDPHIHAFKLFAQNLFVQSVQYVSKMESRRLNHLSEVGAVMTNPMQASAKKTSIRPGAGSASGIKPLYHPDGWIPMMLTMLRSREIHVGDQEIISCFADQSYFPKLYEQLTKEEKAKVDLYLSSRHLKKPE